MTRASAVVQPGGSGWTEGDAAAGGDGASPAAEPALGAHVFRVELRPIALGAAPQVVAEGAAGSAGRLANDTIMLAGGCEIDSKPQLEIYADDVKCAHGSTVGELDEEALFYLRSRGVPEPEARAMLVEGFVATVFDQFEGIEGIEVLSTGIVNWLAELERET